MPSQYKHDWIFSGLTFLAAFASAILLAPTARAEEPIQFAKDIAPIFQKHCVQCHTPGIEKGDISLATIVDLNENEYVSPGEPDASHLLEIISPDGDAPPEMPQEGPPLSAEQVALIRRWIAEGAAWPDDVVVRQLSKADQSWWALQVLSTKRPPAVEQAPNAWRVNPIDRFVFAKLAEKTLTPNPPADRRTLIRRATYDLLGLPPRPEEITAFVDDPQPHAYEKLIDRLLESPHYGERWGRHWLDVVRFGESNGFERNVIINDLWPFRDYVIRSLNDDKPFDQFVREHLAGDVIGAGNPEVEIGAAFLVCGPYDNVGNQDPVQLAQIRANTLDEIIRATGEAFLGLTVGCARCHDHKFDPVVQEDYYALYATFSGIRHGSRVLATPQAQTARAKKVGPLNARRAALTKQRDALNAAVMKRAGEKSAEYEKLWSREKVNRQGTEDKFPAVEARFVRLVSQGQDTNLGDTRNFGVDEFEAWSDEATPRNVALAANGGKASGASRVIKDYPGAYGPQLAIDGKTGRRFLATAGSLTIEFAAPTRINRVLFSSARGEDRPEHRKFIFVADYRIEVSPDGKTWTEVAHGRNRKPVSAAHRNKRLQALEITSEEQARLAELNRQIAAVAGEINAIPALPVAWVGSRVAADAKGPFHVFVGGNPQRQGNEVTPASLVVLKKTMPAYQLPADAPEAQRRQALADWMVDPKNPLTPRVLANRVWHYHFGVGIVDTPSDFGYMGGRPTHPELLDWLAANLLKNGWRLKPLHKQIMLSQTYRQSSEFREDAAKQDGDARLLWRFPPRRLEAEEIRDTVLAISGVLSDKMGGPGFRLYQYLQDNVATYVPLDVHGPETYRRAVYHQNARAARTDLMSDFDQPDCAFSTPRRAGTTTPLQALTMLNHQFTLDMAQALAERLQIETPEDPNQQIKRAYLLCYGREATAAEVSQCVAFIKEQSLPLLCRVLLNTSELIHIR